MSTRTLLKQTSVVSLMTLLSRIMGFVRDVVLASLFGASAGFDAFLIANRVPNFMRSLFAEGAFSQAFVPVLAEYREKYSQEEAMTFMSRTLGFLGGILLLFILLIEIITPLLACIFAPGFLHDPFRFEMTTVMLRITFPYLFLISMTAFFGAVLNSYGVFSVPAFTPVLLNIVLILAAIYLAPHFSLPVLAIAWGIFIAGIIQLLFQLPFLLQKGLLSYPRFVWNDAGVKRVLKLMVPALFGVSVAQISLLLSGAFASFLPAGSISWLYYSDRLIFFPLGIFGIALATVILPHLSFRYVTASSDEFSASLDWSLRCLFLISMPCAVGLFIVAGPLIVTLLHHGEFTVYDVMMTRQSVMAFAIGLPAFMVIKVLATAFYARQDIKKPVRIAIVAALANLFFSSILIFPLAHAGLALATTLSSTLNAVLLYIILRRQKIYQPSKNWGHYWMQLLFSNSVMALMLRWKSPDIMQWLAWGWYQRALNLTELIVMAVVLYVICLWVCGLRWQDFKIKTMMTSS